MDVSRVLFLSCHGYLDPSSGAAISTRALMELLASRGVDARVLSTGMLDYARETPLRGVLDGLGVPYRRARAALSAAGSGPGGGVEVFDMEVHGVRVTLMPTASSRIRSMTPAEEAALVDLAEQIFARFRPQVMMTYGGRPVAAELLRRARRRGIATAFHLRNLEYGPSKLFDDVDGIVVTSAFAGRHYARVLGRECRVIPNSLRRDRVVADDRRPEYLTYINPQPAKGSAVFARIAAELDRRRPEIPVLVVEGRGTADGLAGVGLDLSGLGNLHRMANTPDPRDFYRVSRAVLMPSLVHEVFGLVAAEAMSNGIPVLASDRGALPETVGDGGFVLPVPARCTPAGGVPTAAEVEPWVEVILRLWDDPGWEMAQRARALAASRWWSEDRVIGEYASFFRSIIGRRPGPSRVTRPG